MINLGESLSQKLASGFPQISARTIIRNRYNELKEEILAYLQDGNISANEKMKHLITLNDHFIRLKKELVEYDLGLEEQNQKIWEAVFETIFNTTFVEQASRVPNLHELISRVLLREYDITKLEEINPYSDTSMWLEIIQRASTYARFNMQLLIQVPFMPQENFDTIFGLIMYYFKTLDAIFHDDYIHKFLSDQASEHIRKDLFIEIVKLYSFMILGLGLIQSRIELINLEQYLDYWNVELTKFDFLRGILRRFEDLKAKILENLDRTGAGDFSLQRIFEGKDSSTMLEVKQIALVAISEEIFQILQEIEPPNADRKHLTDLLEANFRKIEKLVEDIDGPTTPNDNYAINLLLSSYIVGHAKMIDLYPFKVDELIAKLSWGARNIKGDCITTIVFPMVVAPTLMTVQEALSKGNIEKVKEAVFSLKQFETEDKQFHPYAEVSLFFLKNVLSLVSGLTTLNEAINQISQVLLANSAFIPSHQVMEMFDQYINYLRTYEEALKRNLRKPLLPLELEAMNGALPVSHLLRHVPILDFYSLKSDYIELKYPIFGDPSFTIYES